MSTGRGRTRVRAKTQLQQLKPQQMGMFYRIFDVTQCERHGNSKGFFYAFEHRSGNIRTPDLYRVKALFNGN